jgi:hypothetical protein
MLIFNLTTLHLWGRTLAKYPHALALACADDGYINAITQQAAFDVAQNLINSSPSLATLSGNVALASFCPEGFVDIGVPIGTHAFVQKFVAKTCRAI